MTSPLDPGAASREGTIEGGRTAPVDGRRGDHDWPARCLRGMPFLEEQRIRRFLAHYLGSANQHIAFGGRAEPIAMFCRWIEGDVGPAFRFLVGPMGRGKSAVICRLLERIASSAPPELGPGAETSTSTTPAIVFVPVSLRFETNGAGTLFSAVDRLARLHGDRAPRDSGLDVRRALLADYLARPLPGGRRLLVVIDGVDEAAGWALDLGCLPRAPAPRTRVLLSLRGTTVDAKRIADRLELGRAAWQVDELGVLGVTGVAELLRHEGLPARPIAPSSLASSRASSACTWRSSRPARDAPFNTRTGPVTHWT